jgi:hypothetical protein
MATHSADQGKHPSTGEGLGQQLHPLHDDVLLCALHATSNPGVIVTEA